MLKHAFALLDLRGIAGPEHNPDIGKLFVEAGHPEVRDDDTSWCAAFANAMIGRAGGKGTGMLRARSFLSWGEPVTKPRRGHVVVIKRGNSNWQGHAFFWLASDGDYVWGIGGNQGKLGAVTVSRFPARRVRRCRDLPRRLLVHLAVDAPGRTGRCRGVLVEGAALMLALIIGLTIIAALAIVGMFFGIRAAAEDEPTEHGDDEP